MLRAYFGDSGRGSGPVFLLAGWLSTAERWAAFNEEWRAILDEEPALKSFKMQHAMTGSGIWRTSHREYRAVRLNSLHSVVTKHTIVGFACAVHHDASEEVLRQGMGFIDTVYWLAFVGVIAETMRYHRKSGLTDKVDFVFDEQKYEFERALHAFLRLRRTEPYLRKYVAGTPRAVSDDDVLPLQAADYLAWQLRRKLASMKDGKPQTRPLMIYLQEQGGPEDICDIPVAVDVWDKSRLLRVQNEHTRQSLAQLEAVDLPSEMKARIRQLLLSRSLTHVPPP